MENVIGLLITIAIVAYSAHRKAKQLRQDPPQQNLPQDASWQSEESDEEWEEDSEEGKVSPQTPDPLQDLIRKFKEEQAKAMRGEASAPAPQRKIVQAEQKTLSDEIPAAHKNFEHQAKRFESAPTSQAPEHTEYAPKKDFTRVTRPEFEEAKSVFDEKSLELEAEISEPKRLVKPSASHHSKFNMDIKDARKGFLWAKVLEDPRFKRRSPYPFILGRRG